MLCVFADYILRHILREKFSVNSPEFYLNNSGKPCLKGDNLHFSISHSGTYVACVVDTAPVGIDIETPRTIHKNTINHCCTEDEKTFICQDFSTLPPALLPNSAEAKRFLSVWTAKEAYLKYTGEGLSGGLNNIATTESNQLKNHIEGKLLTNINKEEYILSIISESH